MALAGLLDSWIPATAATLLLLAWHFRSAIGVSTKLGRYSRSFVALCVVLAFLSIGGAVNLSIDWSRLTSIGTALWASIGLIATSAAWYLEAQ